MEEIILVDENDNEIGHIEKMAAHVDGGKLHRAFSIFLFNSKGELLLQKRAGGKYHFGSLWTNTCCSHPNKGETLEHAVHRRLKEELGIDTDMKEITKFTYRASDPKSGLTEYEIDHVFIGTFDSDPKPNPEEVEDIKWIKLDDLRKDVNQHPEKYTPWFKIILDNVLEYFEKNKR